MNKIPNAHQYVQNLPEMTIEDMLAHEITKKTKEIYCVGGAVIMDVGKYVDLEVSERVYDAFRKEGWIIGVVCGANQILIKAPEKKKPLGFLSVDPLVFGDRKLCEALKNTGFILILADSTPTEYTSSIGYGYTPEEGTKITRIEVFRTTFAGDRATEVTVVPSQGRGKDGEWPNFFQLI